MRINLVFVLVAFLLASAVAQARSTTVIYSLTTPYLFKGQRIIGVDIEYRKYDQPVLRWFELCDTWNEENICGVRYESLASVKKFTQISKSQFLIELNSGKEIVVESRTGKIEVSGIYNKDYVTDVVRLNPEQYSRTLNTKHGMAGNMQIMSLGYTPGWISNKSALEINVPLEFR